MKLGSLKSHSPDGQLVVLSRDLQLAKPVPEIAATMQAALDRWNDVSPALEEVSRELNAGRIGDAIKFDPALALSPLPRSYLVFDASNYLRHHELMGRIYNKPIVGTTFTEPFGYQSGRGILLGPQEDIAFPSNVEMLGIDFEAEVAVVTDRVPMGTSVQDAGKHIKLIMIMNDVSLRNLNLRELEKGFGLFLSKPVAGFAPAAVTPDELGPAWDGDKLHLPIISTFNGTEFGRPNAGTGMLFGFRALVAFGAQTRELGPGSIFGGGTVSNHDPAVGSSCITERRALEITRHGEAQTQFMQFGDRVRIEMLDADGRSIFGAIDQTVTRLPSP
ncbi:fumarylacetoacetate hydrolase family protein [Roseiarcaceae bacterium H3SJ34-1]|uniref:fumarylacetoacetate hydrolase family protein n=1 Tax=Terripilifer ovatus TaxID=3032367 RepID=UPI003AB9929F|nr:fumarylacetoacetate hydrolase family protein [Roseiarcaceae bacterium H3SJ34-1]